MKGAGKTYISKDSFQWGFKVFLMTPVVWVFFASTITTANGSGRSGASQMDKPSAATTIKEDVRNAVSRAKAGDWSSPVSLNSFLERAGVG